MLVLCWYTVIYIAIPQLKGTALIVMYVYMQMYFETENIHVLRRSLAHWSLMLHVHDILSVNFGVFAPAEYQKPGYATGHAWTPVVIGVGGGGQGGGGGIVPPIFFLEARNSGRMGEEFGQNAGRIRAKFGRKFGQKVEEQK